MSHDLLTLSHWLFEYLRAGFKTLTGVTVSPWERDQTCPQD